VLVGGQGPFRGTNALFIMLVAGVAGAVSVQTLRRRNQAYMSMLFVGAGYALAAVSLGLTLGWSWREVGLTTGAGALGAIVSVALPWGSCRRPRSSPHGDVPAPARVVGPEPPADAAPLPRGARHVRTHDRDGEPREQAASAIGANGLLARVGTYYHDIGKLKKPQFFVENQARGATRTTS
jgi:membrane-associated HD superfamily phosphohydrolase